MQLSPAPPPALHRPFARGVLDASLAAARDAARAALAVVLPTECACCGAPDHALCNSCLAGLDPSVIALEITAGRAPPLPVWSALPYDGALKAVVHALKENGRTDVAGHLAWRLLPAVVMARQTLAPLLPPGAELELTLAPSSRAAFRHRGYNPVALLARAVARRVDPPRLRSVETLRVARATRDQAGLGIADRRRNLRGSLAVKRRFARAGLAGHAGRLLAGPPGRTLAGRHFLLVDDVVTTGSTLLECRRALEQHGAFVWGAATLAFTERRVGSSAVRVLSHPGGSQRSSVTDPDEKTTVGQKARKNSPWFQGGASFETRRLPWRSTSRAAT